MHSIESTTEIFQALSNSHRLQILTWLAEPESHFPPQREADLVTDGVCVGHLTAKTGLKQPTVTRHMKILANAGLVSSKQIKNWVFYKLVADRFDQVMQFLENFQQSSRSNVQ